MDFTFIKNTIENSTMSQINLYHSTTGDGRIESAESECLVSKHIQRLFANTEVKVTLAPQARHWYDIMIEYNEKIYPINIKITSGCSADNVSSKLGLFYALTGILPDKQSGLNRWEQYNTVLTQKLDLTTDADYYFIIYFKETGTFLFTSLKRIHKLVSNGNNLPFQCKWSDNIEYTTRTREEQCLYLMEVYYDSWIKKTGGFAPLLQWKEQLK